MDLKLKRVKYSVDGIFSELFDAHGRKIASTIEHSYPGVPPRTYEPKIPPGRYLCRRGSHRLHSMQHDFETFEITGVQGHSNLLFHCGNTQADSEGCVLVGRDFCQASPASPRMINCSRITFDEFLVMQVGISEFYLEVIE